eukprot:TRINITY_DN580_c0_g2_i1.p1 TRINITY_DN580_c0_g2~~TRINITY_DN580_c0_g2_i1.p1  ORF type:complete len:160 (-),score=54.55 TRINITY_DN580_c0_g2_i1:563-976(-)
MVLLRPISEFVRVPGFVPPKSADEALERVRHNADYFLLNYVVIEAAILLIGCLFNHKLLIPILLDLAMGVVFVYVKPGALERILSPLHKSFIFTLGTIFLLYATHTFKVLFICSFFTFLFSAVHAAMLAPEGIIKKD